MVSPVIQWVNKLIAYLSNCTECIAVFSIHVDEMV